VKLLSKYDPAPREHFRRIHENEIRNHFEVMKYTELIELMASKVKETIVNKVKCVKYLAYCWIALEALVVLSR
jgi:hypothetical protein